MNIRRLLLGFSLVFATFGGAKYLHDLRDVTPVVVTTADIPAHTPLTADKLAVRQVSRQGLDTVAAHAVHRIEDAVGLMTRTEIRAGEVVRQEPWLVAGTPGGATSSEARYAIPDGMRLVGLRVDPPAAVAGQISPGDRVDVIFTSKDASTGGLYAQTVLQAVEVFSIGDKGKTGGALDVSTNVDVTLLVTPEQAQILALAKHAGGAVDLSIAPLNPSLPVLTPTYPPAAPRPSVPDSRPPAESKPGR